MAEPESFTAWLHAQGLREKTAQAIVTELGIESYEVLQACTDSITLRAELFSLTKQKFPFAMYAEFHKFVESCLELHIFQPEGPLVDILCSLFEVVSREFFSCSQKLSSLKSPSMSYADENTHLGINISDVCSHQQEEHGGRIQLENLEDAVDPQSTIPPSSQRSLNQLQERLEYASPTQSSNAVSTEPDVIVVVKEEPNIVDGLISQGEIYPVQVESLEGNHASSSTEALSCVSVTEDSYDLQKESCSDSCSAAERSTDHFCELKSRSPLALKEGFFRKQMHPTDSSRNMKSAGCDGRRKVEREFSKHKKIHFGGMQYKCLICSKSFSNLRNMENHMKTQNGKCPLKCSICDKAVTKLSDLKKHMRIHNGERPYNCSICGKSFTQIGNMNRHMMIHTGERPHNCPVCGRGFAESAKLNAHMRTHTGVHYGLPYSIS